MKLTYRFIFSILLFLSITTVFSQNFSDKETGFDAAKITLSLKKRGLTDQNIQEEVALMRKLHYQQYAEMRKSEDEILQKIISEQTLKVETNQIANTGPTAKTAKTLVTDIPQSEKDALLALYNSTNGNSWTNKTGWDFSTPVTSAWYGVTVTAGHITAINLSNNNLIGTIPTAIGQLTEMQWLHLYANQLSGIIPSEIGLLTKLSGLYLHQNQLSGAIPASIGQLSQLQTLQLYTNQLSGTIPVSIGQLTKLTSLFLHQNQLSGTIPVEIGQLILLQTLQLNNNQLTGSIPTSIGQLTQILNFYLHNNKLSGAIPSEIKQLIKSQNINLSSNQLSGTIPSEIGQLTKLIRFYLFDNQLNGKIPVQIGQLTQLQILHLNINKLSGSIPAEIGRLTQLETLTFENNQLSGTIPSEIGKLTQLQTLNLNINQLNGIIPSEIGLLTKLKILRLNNNQLSGAIPNSIGQLTQLQNLYLHNNQLSGTIPTEIGQLTQILEIYLYNNQLKGTIPFQIGQLTKLTSLALYLNQLSGKIPAQIGQLTQLQNLWIQGNQLSGIIPPEIGQLTKLQNLYLQSNKLSGVIPSSIGQLTQLTTLYLNDNQLTGIIPTQISLLTKLQILCLHQNQLSGTIPVEIGELTKLTSLYLYGNQLSGTIPASIGQLTQLVNLFLFTNQLSGTIPASIGQLTQLQALQLHFNQLEGKIPNLTNVISNLNFQYNKFRFVDFTSEYNAYKSKLPVFAYSNQAKTDSEITIQKTTGETHTLTMYEDNQFTPADTYQWYKNGQIIAGATSRQYTLSNLTAANAGDYYCVSTNPQMTNASVVNQNLILTRNTIHLNVSNCNSVLSSAAGTDKQNICLSNVITPITYTTSGLITNATFSGLPVGVTANFASNTVTISGTPTYEGTYSYIVTYVGDCGTTVKATGTITVLATVVNPASATPEICANIALTPITHVTRGGAITVGTPTGLPAGLSTSWGFNPSSTNGGTLIISGTPTTAGVYNYSIPLSGQCGNTVNTTGTITVTNPGTITLSSAAGTDNQSKNVNTIIAPVTYTTTAAEGVTISGLPAGVTGSFASNVVTISGTPTVSGTFNYVITLTDRCATTTSGKITALCEPISGIIKIIPSVCQANVISNSSSQSINSGQTTAITLTSTAVGTTFSWTVVQSGVTGATTGTGNSITQTLTNNGTTNGTATYTITPALGNCTGTPIVIVVTVIPISQSPSIVVNNAICAYTDGAQLPISYYNTPPGSYITIEVTHRDGSSNVTMDESSGYYMLNYFGSTVANSTVRFILYLHNSSGEVIYQTNQTLARRSSWSQLGSCQL